MNAVFILFAIVAGLLNAVQAGMNAALGRGLGPTAGGLTSLAASAVMILAVGAGTGRLAVPSLQQAADVPWWAWLAGFCGGALILGQIFAAPRLGSSAFVGLVVTASILMSVVLDHFGLLGFKQHPAGLARIAGAVLMLAGVGLIARS